MKKTCIGFGALVALVLSTAWFSEGCKGNLPAIPAVVATPLPSGVVSNFNGGSLIMNSSFLNGNGGYFLSETYGGAPGFPNMIDGSNNPNILLPNPGDGSAYAIHIYGSQTDPLPTGYPAMELYGFLKNASSNLPGSDWYDLSATGGTNFTGIRFDMNIPSDDTNPQQLFAIGSAPMVPSITDQGGVCPAPFGSNCYDYFWNDYSATCTSFVNTTYNTQGSSIYNAGLNTYVNTNKGIEGHGWQPISIVLNNLKLAGNTSMYGSAKWSSVTSVTYQKQALFLLWKFGDNGAGHKTYTDFWVDNIQFY